MRIPAAAVIGACVAAVAIAAVTVASTVDHDSGPGHRAGMMSSSGSVMSVDGEYEYLAEMVAHHREAVVAAGQLERSERPEMQAFGEAVIDSQSAQIEMMEQWLADWYPDESGQVDYQPMMRDLGGLSGDALDQAFLEDMVGHHMGAVMMSQQLVMRGEAEHAEVESLAEAIVSEQRAEIVQMQRWLRDWFDPGR